MPLSIVRAAWESRVLEAISSALPLSRILHEVVLGLEALIPDCIASVLLVDADAHHLLRGASSPNLPESYNAAIDGLAVGEGIGSCGTAVHRREPVIVTDIETDPLWIPGRQLAASHGLRACWSFPVLDPHRAVLAAFAVYFRTCRHPDPEHFELLQRTTHLVGIAIQRDRKDADLRASEERFRRTFLDAASGLVVTTSEDHILHANAAFGRMLGIPEAELSGLHLVSLIHPEDSPQFQQLLAHLLSGQREAFAHELRFLSRSGSPVWSRVQVSRQRDADPNSERLITVADNITQQKNAEFALRESQARFASVFRASPAAISINTVADGRFIEVNDRYCEFTGYTRQELMQHTVLGLQLWANPAEREPVIRQLLADGSIRNLETRYRHKSGDLRDVIISLELIELAGIHEPVLIALITDVTDRKRLESQFLRAQRLESLGTLASGVAHDLNNVLAPILLSIGLLKSGETQADRLEILDHIDASARRGAAMIRQMLSFARGTEGTRSCFSPASLAIDLERILRDTFPKNIRLQLPIPDNLWSITGDPTQLHQVLMNLCVNARDAMPQGGTLTLAMENTLLSETEAAMFPKGRAGPYVVLRVDDTGVGIPHDLHERIFDPFFTTKEIGQGSGLGLPTALSIIKSHGGFLNLYSEPGRCARFKIYLPASSLPSSPTPPTPLPPAQFPAGHNELVLVIDDEDQIRSVARKTLERFGYRVLLAANGAEAIALYAQHRQDIAVVLTDMMMPIMDGPATIIALKAMNPEVRVIGSSGLHSNGAVAKAVGAGVQHFVPKPYSAEILLQTLHQILHSQP
jgi:PAS domain S-box-containing protein